MVIKASNQIDLLDLTDGYSVILTNENHTFLGNTTSVEGTQSATTTIMALRGNEQVPAKVGAITTPTGISAVSDGKTPNPTVTITATSALTTSGSITIPVQIEDLTINKVFSFAIAFKGTNGTNGTNGSSVTVSSTEVAYQANANGTTAPTGTWSTSVITAPAGQFLWTRTTVKYSDGKSTVAYAISRQGTNGSSGSSVTVSSTAVTYQASSSGTTKPTGTWATTIPATSAGQYLWTKTVVTYSDGKSTTSYAISRNGTNGSNGADGADAITMAIISSGGSIFKNTAIATTLTAHVYKGGVEATGATLTALGAIKWYKGGATTSIATGSTFTVAAGDVESKASYTAQLEG